jgi:hypothetical protein
MGKHTGMPPAGTSDPLNPRVFTDEHGRSLYGFREVPMTQAMQACAAYLRPDLAGIDGTTPRDRRQAFRNTMKSRCIDCDGSFDLPWLVDLDHRDPKTKTIYHRDRQAKENGDAVRVDWSGHRFFRELTLLDPVCRPCHVKRTAAQNVARKHSRGMNTEGTGRNRA